MEFVKRVHSYVMVKSESYRFSFKRETTICVLACCGDKQHDHKCCGQGKGSFGSFFHSQFVMEGKQGRNLRRDVDVGTEAETAEDCCLPA